MHKFPIPIAHDIQPGKTPMVPAAHGRHRSSGHLAGPARRRGLVIWLRAMVPGAWDGTPRRERRCSIRCTTVSSRAIVPFWNAVSSCFQRVPWNPTVVLVIGVILMMLGMMMLKAVDCDASGLSITCRSRSSPAWPRLAFLDDERRLGDRRSRRAG